MPPITFQDLPLNIYMVIFGTGIFIFVLSLIFCCYFISKLRQQAQSERFGYKEVTPGVFPHQPGGVWDEQGHSGDRGCAFQSAGTGPPARNAPGSTRPRTAPFSSSRGKILPGVKSSPPSLLQVVLKGDARRLNVHGQTCAVCLEDFRVKEELGVLPCQHAFHRKCLVKWLEVRCVCPMCNKPMAGPGQPRAGIGTLLDELV
ncbi:RING finger protein 122 isoform 1-T1 [Cyanocitta cristata]